MKIKVCGMKIPENIKAVANMGIDLMGFIFYEPSPRFVGTDLAIKESLGDKISGVGVFVNESIDEVQKVLNTYSLKFVQLHGKESPSYCRQMKAAGYTVIKAFRVNQDFDFDQLKTYLPACDFFLFDTKGKTHGGTGKKFDWTILQQYTYNKPFFLSGGIGPADVDAILRFKHPQLYALDLNSRFEIAPGEKNTTELNYFLKEII